jgi:predicted nucleotidyltransferase
LSNEPDWFAGQALYSLLPNDRGYFTDSRYENLGGLAIFWPDSDNRTPAQYNMQLYVNAFALPATRLPHDFVKALKGIRLWDDPTEPNPALKGKRLAGDDRLDRIKILNTLAKRDVLNRCGVRNLSLFGSAARGENDPASDLDFVVELDPKTFARYMGLKEYLENLFWLPR